MGQIKITRESRKYFELDANKNTTQKNFSDTTKAVPRRKFVGVNIYNVHEGSQINHLCFCLNKLE